MLPDPCATAPERHLPRTQARPDDPTLDATESSPGPAWQSTSRTECWRVSGPAAGQIDVRTRRCPTTPTEEWARLPPARHPRASRLHGGRRRIRMARFARSGEPQSARRASTQQLGRAGRLSWLSNRSWPTRRATTPVPCSSHGSAVEGGSRQVGLPCRARGELAPRRRVPLRGANQVQFPLQGGSDAGQWAGWGSLLCRLPSKQPRSTGNLQMILRVAQGAAHLQPASIRNRASDDSTI